MKTQEGDKSKNTMTKIKKELQEVGLLDIIKTPFLFKFSIR